MPQWCTSWYPLESVTLQLVDENGENETPTSWFLLEIVGPPMAKLLDSPMFRRRLYSLQRPSDRSSHHIHRGSTHGLYGEFVLRVQKIREILAHETIAAFQTTENRRALVCQCGNRFTETSCDRNLLLAAARAELEPAFEGAPTNPRSQCHITRLYATSRNVRTV